MKLLLLAAQVAAFSLVLCACTPLQTPPDDPLTELPLPQPFDGSALPGSPPRNPDELETRWYGRNLQHNAELRDGVEPRLESSIHLWLQEDGRYQLVYSAQWGVSSRPDESGYRGVDVRESGRYALSGETLHLEPAVTEFTQLSGGNRNTQAISGEKRSYVVHLDERYLNVAGRCASYQVDPVCKEARDVWFSLRQASASGELR